MRDDGLFYLLRGTGVSTGRSDAFDVQVYGWRQGSSVDEIIVPEPILWAGVLGGDFYTRV